MAKNIRSEYLQQLIEDKNGLESKLKEVTKSTIESIMGENIETKLRKIISEDEDSFIEDEVDDDSIESSEDENDEVISDTETETTVDDTDNSEDSTEITDTTDVVDGTDSEEDTATDEEDIWNDLEQYKGADGEYDLTGMDADNLIKVMQVMKPADGIRVVKNDNGTITLSDDDTDKEYIIDIETENDSIEDSISDEGVEESKKEKCCNEETNLGYTDNFQNKTAMTTPPNTEPANPKTTYSMDGGAPTGTEKRWANQGDKAPFDENVNEECEFEIELDDEKKDKKEDEVNETMTTQEQGPYNRGTGMVHTNTNTKAAKGRNAHAGGEQISGTADNSYSKSQLENIMRKANAIFKENKELKALVPKMQQQMMESIVINKSMGNVMRIVMENSTSINEKKEILKRFTSVKTIEESDKLYHTISEELKREGKTMNMNNVINSQLAESKNSVVETPMYQSEDLSKTLNLINRLNKIK